MNTLANSNLNRHILRIALPSIVSNITVPLLSLVDTAIVGHLGAAAYIGAIALGGMVFNMAYWLFGFLRMGTSGLTAQAYGAGNRRLVHHTLFRSLLLALAVSLALIVLQGVIFNTTFRFVAATPQVRQLAHVYFSTLIWGAPAVLCLYSFTGWFLGQQNARLPMFTAVAQNVVNIACSAFFVFVLRMKVEGVALGTLIAQYAGLAISLVAWRRTYFPRRADADWRGVLRRSELGKFFATNRDIFLRTFFLIAVTTSFTAFGSAQGETVLAANTLLMQFFVVFSYVMDGFAYAGEALGGKFVGARSRADFHLLARRLFVWGVALSVLFTLLYVLCGPAFLGVLTDNHPVADCALRFFPYVCAVPLAGFAAFLFDGLFIGATSTRFMLAAVALASALYFGLVGLLPQGNHGLWLAFLSYLACRGLVQALLYPRVAKKIA